jgi:hypothetical protein
VCKPAFSGSLDRLIIEKRGFRAASRSSLFVKRFFNHLLSLGPSRLSSLLYLVSPFFVGESLSLG